MKSNEKKVIIGTLMLTIFGLLCKALGAVYKIGLTAIVGSYGMGLYQLLFPVLVFFIVFSSEGFATALTVKQAENKEYGWAYFRLSIISSIIISLVSFLIINLASPLFETIQGGQLNQWLYFIVSIGVIVISILSIIKARIRGAEKFVAYSLFEALEDVLKVVFALGLAWQLSSYGIMGSVAGIFIGIILSSFVTFIALMFYRPSGMITIKRRLSKEQKKEYLRFVFFTMAGIIVIPAIQFIESGIVVGLLQKSGASELVATKLYGISRGSVSAIINLPFFIISAVEVLLLPNLSRSKKEGIYFKKTQLSLLFAVLVSVPFVLGFMMFSSEIVGLLYGGTFIAEETIIATKLLRIGAAGIFFSAITSFLVVILNSNNKTLAPFIANLIAGIVKIVFIIVLTPRISIYAIELSSVLFSMLVCLINLIFAIKYKVIKKPRFVLVVIILWVIIFSIIKFIYGLFKGVISSNIIALICSGGIVFGLIAVIIAVVWNILRKKNIIIMKRQRGYNKEL